MEKDTVRSIVGYLKTLPQTFVWKEHGGMYGTAGIPDVICCHKGRFIAFEVKTETGKATLLQEITLRRITEAGGIAVLVRSLDEVKAVLEGLKDG